eukprot:1818396-Rhodomonas_salina.4
MDGTQEETEKEGWLDGEDGYRAPVGWLVDGLSWVDEVVPEGLDANRTNGMSEYSHAPVSFQNIRAHTPDLHLSVSTHRVCMSDTRARVRQRLGGGGGHQLGRQRLNNLLKPSMPA